MTLTYDKDTQTLLRDGKEIYLTRLEHRLFTVFLRHKKRFWSPNELLLGMYGTAELDSISPRVYVGYLRKKLGKEAIRTWRGIGYRLDADVEIIDLERRGHQGMFGVISQAKR